MDAQELFFQVSVKIQGLAELPVPVVAADGCEAGEDECGCHDDPGSSEAMIGEEEGAIGEDEGHGKFVCGGPDSLLGQRWRGLGTQTFLSFGSIDYQPEPDKEEADDRQDEKQWYEMFWHGDAIC